MVEGGGGEDCVKAVGLHARVCACLAADGGGGRRISPYIKTILPMGVQEGSQNFKNCVS